MSRFRNPQFLENLNGLMLLFALYVCNHLSQHNGAMKLMMKQGELPSNAIRNVGDRCRSAQAVIAVSIYTDQIMWHLASWQYCFILKGQVDAVVYLGVRS